MYTFCEPKTKFLQKNSINLYSFKWSIFQPPILFELHDCDTPSLWGWWHSLKGISEMCPPRKQIRSVPAFLLPFPSKRQKLEWYFSLDHSVRMFYRSETNVDSETSSYEMNFNFMCPYLQFCLVMKILWRHCNEICISKWI